MKPFTLLPLALSEYDEQARIKIDRVLNKQDWPLSAVEVGILNTDIGSLLIVNFHHITNMRFATESEGDEIFKRVIVFLIHKGAMKKFAIFQSAIIVSAKNPDGTDRLFRKKIFCDDERLRVLEKSRFVFWSPLSRKPLDQLITEFRHEYLYMEPMKKVISLPLPP